MAKKSKKTLALLLSMLMLTNTMGITASAATPTDTPEVTIRLTPGETTTDEITITDKKGTLTREVTATTGEIIVDTEDSYGEMKAPQSALKFDRNSSSDQTAQRKVRDLYTDNGHFTDPASITVTDAPEGYQQPELPDG